MSDKLVDLLGTNSFGEDGQVVVSLSFGQRKVVQMLGENGRRMTLDMAVISPQAADGVNNLGLQGVIHITPLLGSTRAELWLTDLGVQVWDQMWRRS